MEISQLTGFLLVSITLACTPGADWAYIISSALGKSSYRPAVWGLLSGYLFHTALLVCGMAALVASSPNLLMGLTMAGSLYLLWLGISTLRSWKKAKFYDGSAGPRLQEVAADPTPDAPQASASVGLLQKAPTEVKSTSAWRAPFFKGLLTSGTNPKALLLYVALIPQFLDSAQPMPMTVQTAILGLGHFVVSIAVYFSVAKAARVLLRSRPVAARMVTFGSGIIMIGLALGLIYEQFFVV